MGRVKCFLEVNEGDNRWEVIRFHTFNDSPEVEDLCHRGALRAEAVLIDPELQIDDSADVVEDYSSFLRFC